MGAKMQEINKVSKRETNRIKREVMNNIIKVIPKAKILDKMTIETPKNIIKVFASRDYHRKKYIGNFYGLINIYLNQIKKANKDVILLLITGRLDTFLMIPYKDTNDQLMPVIRKTKDGDIISPRRMDNNWILLIPKKEIKKFGKEYILLNKYVNNLSPVNGSYQQYLKILGKEKKPEFEEKQYKANKDEMEKDIEQQDPGYIDLPIEEKLIRLRYLLLK